MVEFVTPYVSKEIRSDMLLWSKGPAFVRVLEQRMDETACKNCCGEGQIYISFCSKGPTQAPVTIMKPSTFFEGNEQYRKGWYLIEETKGYQCPHCRGSGEEKFEA